MSKPVRYRIADNQAQLTLGGNILEIDSNGGLVLYYDYARLNEEVKRLEAVIESHKDAGKRILAMLDEERRLTKHLKAEVERLNTGIQPEGSNDAVGRAVNVLLEKEKENARLKAEVERLTKAGDAMEMTLQADFNGCPYEPTIVREAMIYWRTAKQGGQP